MFNTTVKHWDSVKDLDALCVLQSDFFFFGCPKLPGNMPQLQIKKRIHSWINFVAWAANKCFQLNSCCKQLNKNKSFTGVKPTYDILKMTYFLPP